MTHLGVPPCPHSRLLVHSTYTRARMGLSILRTRIQCSRYSDRNLSGRRRRGRSLFITVQHCSITVHQVLFTTVYHCSDKSGPFTVKMDGSDRVQSLSCSRSSDCRRSPSRRGPREAARTSRQYTHAAQIASDGPSGSR